MPRLRRAILALGVVLLTGCGSSETLPLPPGPAPPQKATLGWVERFPSEGPALVFGVHRFEVTPSGWTAEVELENHTRLTWRIVESPATAFGVMLFTTDEVTEVERRSREDDLPGLRPARRFDPPLPKSLAAGTSWRGTIAAPGRLAAELHVRVVFGQLVAVGEPPEDMPTQFSWITDNSYRLRAARA